MTVGEDATTQVHFDELLRSAPRNWGRWGADDEVGALNFLTSDEVLRGMRAVRQGKVFTLGAPVAGAEGEPVWPGRAQAQRFSVRDRASYTAGRLEPFPGGLEYADDTIAMYLQGTTHFDGIGHAWYGDQIYNGFSANETVGHMSKASVYAIGERGVVGHGVLVDVARYKGKIRLDRGEPFTLDDVLGAAEQEGVEIGHHDVLLIRTGWLGLFYEDREAFYAPPFAEPGLVYNDRVGSFFHDHEIAVLGTDTIANELQPQPHNGVMSVLHAELMRNLGVAFVEILRLDVLAEDCAKDGQWEFCFVAAPIKVVGGTGAPTNPVVIK